MKIDRLLGIVLLLIKRRKMTAVELSCYFEVSVRTIYRDIGSIEAAGIPIVSIQGISGGFEILDSYTLERQLFSAEDMLSILGMLKGVEDALGDERIHSTTQKVAKFLPPSSVDTLFDELKIEILPWGDEGLKRDTLLRLQQAVAKRMCVRFEYLNSQREHSEREVEPMTLVFKGSSWYLFGYCLLKEDYRLFKISRIRSCVVQPHSFSRREKKYEEFAQQSKQRAHDEMIPLSLRFDKSARFLVEDFFLPQQISGDADGSLNVEVSLPDGDWIYSMLLSFGGAVEVKSPKRVRQQLWQRATALADKNA